MSGEGQSYLLPISGLDQIVNIDKWSNTDVPGLWIYRSLTLGEDACLNLLFVESFHDFWLLRTSNNTSFMNASCAGWDRWQLWTMWGSPPRG